MADITLYLGNKNYSSWSLRAWLVLKRTGAAFDETVIPLRQADTREQILRHSPSGKVPVLDFKGTAVWDSLAIAEFLAEAYPKANLWPKDREARARARAVSAEMHSGFPDLRRSMPMNMRSSFPGREITPETQADINRITAIWRDCRSKAGQSGDFLFGEFTIADAMFAPVASRFKTYGIALEKTPGAYAETLLNLPDMKEWSEAAHQEPWVIPDFEF